MSQLGRRVPNAGELEAIVYAEVESMVANSFTFTAYMITKTIRERNAQLEITHADVQEIVHGYMETKYDGVSYESEQRLWDGNWARTWFPSMNPGVVTGKVAAVAALPSAQPPTPEPPAPKTTRKPKTNTPPKTAPGLPAPIDLSAFDDDTAS